MLRKRSFTRRGGAIAAALLLHMGYSQAFVPSTHLSQTSLVVSPMSIKPPAPDEKAKKLESAKIAQEIEAFDPFFLQGNGVFQDNGVERKELILNNDHVPHGESEEDNGIGIWAARGLLVMVAILWGTNFASVKYLETLCFHPPCNHPPSEAALARFGVAALVSLPFLWKQQKDVILGGLECGMWITLGYITQAMALKDISSSKCAFICSLTVVIVPLISSIFYGKKIKPMNIISAAIAISGVGVLEGLIDLPGLLGIQIAVAETLPHALPELAGAETTVKSSSIATSSVPAAVPDVLTSFAMTLGVGKGDLLALGQPFGFGLSFMRIEHYVEKFKHVENRVLTISAAQCLSVGLISLLWVLYDFHGVFPNFSYMMDWHRLVAVAWTGIMTTVVAIYLEGIALQTASASEAALTFASEPVWATLFGAYLLHEKLNINSYIGGSIILIACILGAVSDIPHHESEG